MRVLLIGKDNILSWTKNVDKALGRDSKIQHDVVYINKLGLLNDLTRNIKKIITKKNLYNTTKNIIENKIKSFNPDMILVISPFGMNEKVFESFDILNKKVLKVAWIGDIFGSHHKHKADYFDKLYFTDTHFLDLAMKYTFPSAEYLPLAVDETVFYNMNKERNNKLLFIGAYTNKRANVINSITNSKIKLIGPGWNGINKDIDYNDKTINTRQVVQEYNDVNFVLNMKHEHNVVNGLNMRSFEVLASGACLLQDYVKDVELNFEVNKDIIVYNNIEELNDMLMKLQKDKVFMKSIIKNGEKLVLSNHTYKNRIDKILEDL